MWLLELLWSTTVLDAEGSQRGGNVGHGSAHRVDVVPVCRAPAALGAHALVPSLHVTGDVNVGPHKFIEGGLEIRRCGLYQQVTLVVKGLSLVRRQVTPNPPVSQWRATLGGDLSCRGDSG